MEKKEYLSILMEGKDAWNTWKSKREVEPKDDVLVDLTGLHLVNINFEGFDFSLCDFSSTVLVGANFDNANFNYAELQNANLAGASFVNSNLHGADFRYARLWSSKFVYTDIRRTNFDSADLRDTQFIEVNAIETLIPGDLKDSQEYEAIQEDMEHRAIISDDEIRFCTSIFSKARFDGGRIENCEFIGCDFSGANFYGTEISNSDLRKVRAQRANFESAIIQNVDLRFSDLRRCNFEIAEILNCDLLRSKLDSATLIKTNFQGTVLNRSSIYGTSVWDIKEDPKEQLDLLVTPDDQLEVLVDNLKIAQFVYLLLENQEVQSFINTFSSKAVLILGRFAPENKMTLDVVKEILRQKGYMPIIFDFEPSINRSFTETIQLLANISRFVIADITNAKSIPQELSHIIPNLPSVPLVPIIEEGHKEYAMFEHWSRFESVLPLRRYSGRDDLVLNFEDFFELPVNRWLERKVEYSEMRNRILELEEEIALLKTKK